VNSRFNDIVAWQNQADGVTPSPLVQPQAATAGN
jgi:hypothetical protein